MSTAALITNPKDLTEVHVANLASPHVESTDKQVESTTEDACADVDLYENVLGSSTLEVDPAAASRDCAESAQAPDDLVETVSPPSSFPPDITEQSSAEVPSAAPNSDTQSALQLSCEGTHVESDDPLAQSEGQVHPQDPTEPDVVVIYASGELEGSVEPSLQSLAEVHLSESGGHGEIAETGSGALPLNERFSEREALESLTSSISELTTVAETKKRESVGVGATNNNAAPKDHDRSEEFVRGSKVPKTMPIDPLIPLDGKPRDGTPILDVITSRALATSNERSQKFHKAKLAQIASSKKLQDMEVSDT